MSYDLETIDEDRGIVRVVETGELRAFPRPDNSVSPLRQVLSLDADERGE